MTNEFGLTAPPLADGGCDPRGCYKDEVHYNSTTINQIEALMEVSSHCEQKIAHNCSVNAIRSGWNIEIILYNSNIVTHYSRISIKMVQISVDCMSLIILNQNQVDMLTGQIAEDYTNLNTGMAHMTILPKDANAV